MGKSKKAKSGLRISKTMVRIIYYAVLLLVAALSYKNYELYKINPVAEKIFGIFAGLYLIFGLAMKIIIEKISWIGLLKDLS